MTLDAGEPDHLDLVRARLLEAALPHAPFDGWSERTLRLAKRDSGIEPGLAKLALPRGPIDLVEFFWSNLDRRMEEELAGRHLEGLSIRARIALALRVRLELLLPHKEAARRAAALQALPLHPGSGPRSLWRSVDAIWRAIGDTSTDFSFYTKRATLAALWSAVLFTWFGDTSPDYSETLNTLDRRLADVMRFERAKAGLKTLARGLPSPVELLARLRYPEPAGPRVPVSSAIASSSHSVTVPIPEPDPASAPKG